MQVAGAITVQLPLPGAQSTGSDVMCTPTWPCFGSSCTSGTVRATRTIAGAFPSTMGLNGGIGFTGEDGSRREPIDEETSK